MDKLPAKVIALIEPEPNSGCWLWAGGANEKGYGRCYPDGARSPWKFVHRLTYEVIVGPIPDGLELDHLCRVRCCVNPRHLEPVTHAVNVRRGRVGELNRRKTHCPRGHPYDVVTARGRSCRTCSVAATRAWRAARRAA